MRTLREFPPPLPCGGGNCVVSAGRLETTLREISQGGIAFPRQALRFDFSELCDLPPLPI